MAATTADAPSLGSEQLFTRGGPNMADTRGLSMVSASAGLQLEGRSSTAAAAAAAAALHRPLRPTARLPAKGTHTIQALAQTRSVHAFTRTLPCLRAGGQAH